AGGTHSGRKTAGDGGTDPQLYGWCSFGIEGRRCAESEHAGTEGAFAIGRLGEALKQVSGARSQVSGKSQRRHAPRPKLSASPVLGRPPRPCLSSPQTPTFFLRASAPQPAHAGSARARPRSGRLLRA